MILLVDIGNTRIKWGWLDGEALTHLGQEIRPSGDFDSFGRTAWGALTPPQRVVVSNVAGPAAHDALVAFVGREWNITPEFVVSASAGQGVTNAYPDPQKLGTDRWAALIGARSLVGVSACLVVDAGTAITIDVLTHEGMHQGGLIIPGIEMMRRALTQDTALIGCDHPLQNLSQDLLARDTESAVNAGSLYAAIAVIDRVAADVANAIILGESLITGGDADTLLPLLAGHFRHEPNLVLKGLAVIAQPPQ